MVEVKASGPPHVLLLWLGGKPPSFITVAGGKPPSFITVAGGKPPSVITVAGGKPPSVITVAGGKQGHAACKILSLQQSLFYVSVEFHGDHKTVTKIK